jgi:hypothetical protein
MLSHKQQRKAAAINQGSMRTCSDCARRNSCVLFSGGREWARIVWMRIFGVWLTHATSLAHQFASGFLQPRKRPTESEWDLAETTRQVTNQKPSARITMGGITVMWCDAEPSWDQNLVVFLPRNLSLGVITETSPWIFCNYLQVLWVVGLFGNGVMVIAKWSDVFIQN